MVRKASVEWSTEDGHYESGPSRYVKMTDNYAGNMDRYARREAKLHARIR